MKAAPAGAFGKQMRPAVARPAPTERDRERRRMLGVLMVEYSYDELETIAANMRRDAERSTEIAEMFAELGGYERVEDALFDTHLWRLARRREDRRFARKPSCRSLATIEKLRNRHREYYQRVIADPVRRIARKAADRARYLRRMSDPEVRDRLRKVARERARKDKDKRAAVHKAWQQRIRRERTPVYLRRLEYERERIRLDYQDPERREKRRKASRECVRRKRQRLKAEDPAAYRAWLDARNAKRTPNRASPRWHPPRRPE